MSEHRMVAPPSAIEACLASRLAKLAALAGPPGLSDAQYRRLNANEYERRFRAQAGDRLRPEVTKACVDTIRAATMERGPAHGAGVAIDVAKRVAGVDLK